MPLLPYLSAAVTAAGLSYKPYITRSGPECSPQSQLRVQITSHLATPFCLLSTLLTVTQAAKTPSRQLARTDTQFCVRAHQAQNTPAKPGVNHHTKSSLQSPVSSQRAVRRRGGTWTIWLIEEGGKKFGQKTREENWGQAWKRLGGRGGGGWTSGWPKEEKRSWKILRKRGKNAPRCLGGFTESSKLLWQCHGNSWKFPDPEHHGNDVAAHRGERPRSLPAVFVNISRDKPRYRRAHTSTLRRPQPSLGAKWVTPPETLSLSSELCVSSLIKSSQTGWL